MAGLFCLGHKEEMETKKLDNLVAKLVQLFGNIWIVVAIIVAILWVMGWI